MRTGRPLVTRGFDGSGSTAVYTVFGVQITDANGATRTDLLDPWQRLVAVEERLAAQRLVTRMGLDPLGRLVEVVDPSGAAIETIRYDRIGSRLRIDHRDAGARLSALDARGRSPRLRVLLTGATSLEGLVWDAQRGTFLSAADRGDTKDLVTINRATGAVVFLNAVLHSGFKDIEALAFLPGSPIVPVAMQALDAERTATGARLAWESARDDVPYSVERALDAAGPWTAVARVSAPVSGRAPKWRFEFSDHDAGLYAARTLHYRVGAVDESGVWAYVTFEVSAVAPSSLVHR
jgi:YD repeat-containing protein